MDQLTDLIARRAQLTPDKLALREVETGFAVTYAQLDARAERAATVLEALGVVAGDRVAVLCRNRIAFFEILFACAKLGGILVPLNWRMPAAELAPLLETIAPRVLMFGAEDRLVAAAIQHEGMACVDLDRAYESLLTQHEPRPRRSQWPASETWYLLFTSGTTGRPKAVTQTYGMALANAVNLGHAINLTRHDSTVNFLPLFHTGGINLYTLPTLFAGGAVNVLQGFDANIMFDLIDSRAFTTFFGVPTVYQQLGLHPRFETVDLSWVRQWGCGGAPLPDETVRKFADRGAIVCNGFGMTETGPTTFLMDGADALSRVSSIGKPQLLCDARIVGPDGSDVPIGAPGEIWLRGPGVTPGYWRDPTATSAAFAEGGWLKTGDLGRRDADGFYFIVGRAKEMYISGGENVYPAEVERALAEHPAVLEAAVVGVPDDRWGETGRAYLLLRPGESPPREEDLIAFCRTKLAPYKAPRSWVYVQDFPRTAAGKVQKHLLTRQEITA